MSKQENLRIAKELTALIKSLKIKAFNSSDVTLCVTENNTVYFTPENTNQHRARMTSWHQCFQTFRNELSENCEIFLAKSLMNTSDPTILSQLDKNEEQAMIFLGNLYLKIKSLTFTLKHKHAGCGEYCAIAMVILDTHSIPFEMVKAEMENKRVNHNFIVIGRNPNSRLRDISTWGSEAVIIDLWYNYTYADVDTVIQNPQTFPFYQYRYFESWKWHILLSSAPSCFLNCERPEIRSRVEATYTKIMQDDTPREIVGLRLTTTDTTQFLNMCGVNEIPERFLCAEEKTLMDCPMTHNVSKKTYDISSLTIAQLPKEAYDFDANLRTQIREFLYAKACKSGKYDCLRFEMPLRDVTDKHHLQHFSSACGRGQHIRLILIQESKKIVSINYFWLFLQLRAEKRGEFLRLFKLSELGKSPQIRLYFHSYNPLINNDYITLSQ